MSSAPAAKEESARGEGEVGLCPICGKPNLLISRLANKMEMMGIVGLTYVPIGILVEIRLCPICAATYSVGRLGLAEDGTVTIDNTAHRPHHHEFFL